MDRSPLTRFVKYLQVIVFTAAVLYFGSMLFIPLLLGLLIALVMYPVCRRLENWGITKSAAITCCLLFVALVFGLIALLFLWQVKTFSADAPAIFLKLQITAQQIQHWLNDKAGVSVEWQHNWLQHLSENTGSWLQATVQTTIDTFFILFLTPVYTALLLYHRRLLVNWLKLVVPPTYQDEVDVILHKTVRTYFDYIKGMVLVYLIVGILNTAGLMALGIEHALLFGILCAIMTIIPYIGIMVSALLPISLAWLHTGNIWYPIGVIAVFSFVQYLEANIIFPKVVGAQLHISTLAVLVSVIAGGIIWGVAGMILFIPIVSLLKIISEHINEWKPLNQLLERT